MLGDFFRVVPVRKNWKSSPDETSLFCIPTIASRPKTNANEMHKQWISKHSLVCTFKESYFTHASSFANIMNIIVKFMPRLKLGLVFWCGTLLCLGEWKSLSVLIFARYSSFCYLWMAAICKRRREHGDIFLKKGCEKPGALKLIACINFSSKRRIEMWRVIFEYVRLHNPSSTALPIMVCAEINAGH